MFPALVFLAAVNAAQAQYKAPRTPDGQPDLQGIWTNASLTPFERPAAFAGKEFFTEKEGADYIRQMAQQNNRDKRAATPEEDVGLAYNEAWFDRGSQLSPNKRTSVVIDPKDGRVPALTSQAREAAAKRAVQQRRLSETPRDFTLNVRCLLWGTAGPPMLPGPYNNNYQILETKDYVAIQVEMIHDTRIIPLDGRKHLDQSVRPWMGDSIGHFEGDTLVVDTTNFRDDYSFRGSDANLHLTERFTRTAPGTIQYQFTVDNPSAFTHSWTGEVMMTSAAGPLYEYACHEGNEALADMLRGARAQEKTAQERK